MLSKVKDVSYKKALFILSVFLGLLGVSLFSQGANAKDSSIGNNKLALHEGYSCTLKDKSSSEVLTQPSNPHPEWFVSCVGFLD